MSDLHEELNGTEPSDWLPAQPLPAVIARHTVGMADPLGGNDVPDAERIQDGLPQSLEECLEQYGLTQLKIKLSGHAEHDIQRLQRIRDVCSDSEIAFSVDGNEQFTSVDDFRQYWEALQSAPELSQFWKRLLFVEQPFHRRVALDANALSRFSHWADRPQVIIDESDAEVDSLRRALELGYHGTSHKNCKGVFKSVANACLMRWRRQHSPHEATVFSGEDLANIGPVALLQDLAVAAALGIESVERNGHHYFSGLSAFSDAIQRAILTAHPDLYHRAAAGWPTLSLKQGRLQLASVNAAALGVGFVVPLEEFRCIGRW